MKILVLGAYGQLGKCLYDQLIESHYEVIFTSREEVDICEFKLVKDKINSISPNIIINAIAYTAVDKAENDFKTANLVNHLAVANLANIANSIDSCLIHVSTDYVFDGTSSTPYTEKSEPNPQTAYGLTKLLGEQSIQSSGCKYLIIRTSWVFSEYGNNFFKTMLKLGSELDEIQIVGDQIGCPTYAQDIAKAIVITLPRVIKTNFHSKLYHFSGNDYCSWFEFARGIFKEAKSIGFKTPEIIKSIPSSDFPTIAKRPIYSVMDSTSIVVDYDIEQLHWTYGVREALSKIKN